MPPTSRQSSGVDSRKSGRELVKEAQTDLANLLWQSCDQGTTYLSEFGTPLSTPDPFCGSTSLYDENSHNYACEVYMALQNAAEEALNTHAPAVTYNQLSDAANNVSFSLASCHRADHYAKDETIVGGSCHNPYCFGEANGLLLPRQGTSPTDILRECGGDGSIDANGDSKFSRQQLRNAMTRARAPRGDPLRQKTFYASLKLAEGAEQQLIDEQSTAWWSRR